MRRRPRSERGGKTTTVEILEGYRTRDSGSVTVLGVDPAHGGTEMRQRIGIVLQECGVDPYLTVTEVLTMHVGYYHHPLGVPEVIDIVGLREKATAVYLCGIVGNVIVVALILTALLVGLGVIAYGVTFPGRYLALVLAIVVGAFCFSALGIAVSTLVPNEDAAPAIINFVLFPLLFISGTFGPVSSTSALGRVAVLFPVRHLVQAMVHVFNPFGGGTGIVATHTLMMLAWGVVGLVVSLRDLRWEPRIK